MITYTITCPAWVVYADFGLLLLALTFLGISLLRKK